MLCIKPPVYNAPETTGIYDFSTGVFFSADCFGALLKDTIEKFTDIPPAMLKEGMVTWATVDAPWLALANDLIFGATLDRFRQLAVRSVLSAHLPPAFGSFDLLLDHLILRGQHRHLRVPIRRRLSNYCIGQQIAQSETFF